MSRASNLQMSLDAAKGILRSASLRCTAARIAVVQCLADHAQPLSSAEVADHLREFGFDKSTIYRSLTELNQVGLVTRLDLGDSVRRFELLRQRSDGAAQHPHFMCMDCGKVVCLSDFQFQLIPADPSCPSPGAISEVLIKGHCEACH